MPKYFLTDFPQKKPVPFSLTMRENYKNYRVLEENGKMFS